MADDYDDERHDERQPILRARGVTRTYHDGSQDICVLDSVDLDISAGEKLAITGESGDVVDARLAGESRRVLLSVHPAATLYDRSQRDGFFETIARAGELSGVGGERDGSDGQSRLGEF